MQSNVDYNWILAPIYSLLPQLPLIILYLVGVVIALARLKKHPSVSLLTIISIVISLVALVVLTFVQNWLPYYAVEFGADSRSVATYYYGLSLVSSLIHALAFGLILFAIFKDRSRISSKPLD